jgi:RND family efflux transporter MFP subunit
MNHKLKFLTGVLMILAMVWGCEKEKTQPEIIRPVLAIKLEKSTGFGGRSFPGRAEATTELNLGFDMAGTIFLRPVNKGDKVKKGQLLARLDPRDFKNEIDSAIAQRNRDKAYRDRIAEALRAGAVSKQELTDAEARLEQSRALVRIKRKALEDSHIYAPFDGIVSWTYKEEKQRVQAKEVVLRLLDISEIEFTVAVPETLISRAPDVKDITITFDAFPGRKVSARIKEIGAEASAGTRTYPLTLIFDQPKDINIKPGMAGTATSGGPDVLKDDTEPEFLLPLTALFTTDGKSHKVWVIDESSMTVKPHEVTRGQLTARGQYVKGLKEGMWVAVAGVDLLREGQKVTILESGKGR